MVTIELLTSRITWAWLYNRCSPWGEVGDSPLAGTVVGDIVWPPDTVLVGIIRGDRPIAPTRDDALEAHDELMFITVPESEDLLQALLTPPDK